MSEYVTERITKTGDGTTKELVRVYRCYGETVMGLDGEPVDAPHRELVCTLPDADAAGVLTALADELGAEVSPP